MTVVSIDPPTVCGHRLPPFGREVEEFRGCANVYVYCGDDAWARARERRESRGPGHTMLLPPGEEPDTFRWPYVSNAVLVVAICESRARAYALAHAIVGCGTPMALAMFDDFQTLIVRDTTWRPMA